MQAETKKNASREKRVSIKSPPTAALVANGAKNTNVWVEMTAACFTGPMASICSRRLRVPFTGSAGTASVTSAPLDRVVMACSSRPIPSLQNLHAWRFEGLLLNLAGRVRRHGFDDDDLGGPAVSREALIHLSPHQLHGGFDRYWIAIVH